MLLLLVGITVNAQDKPVIFGVKAGVNMSNLNGDIKHNDVRFGYNIGVTLDYKFTPELYLLTGLDLTTKGLRINVDDVKASSNLIYLQLPVHVGYKLSISEITKLVFYAGPYVAYGIGGKHKEDAEFIEVKTDSFRKYGYKRFDFGLGLGVGAEFGKIVTSLGYDFGLTNINGSGSDGKIRNSNAYLTLGYKFKFKQYRI